MGAGTKLSAPIPHGPIRMSWGDICSLAAYHELVGTPTEMDYNSVALRMGKALEPFIVQMVADNGLDLYFTDNPPQKQLEIAHEDPYRTGHPDGAIVRLSDPSAITPWLFGKLPGEAMVRLLSGTTAVLEAKALNARNFKIFVEKGFTLDNSLFRKYYGQMNEYIHTLMDVKSDELWESGDFRAVINSGVPRPSWILVAAFNKETHEFHFRYYDPDTEFFEKSNARLHIEVIQEMDAGRVPKPSYDGRGSECFWCPFKAKCPAFLGLTQSEIIDLDDLPVMAPQDPKLMGHLDALAAEYADVSARMAALDAQRKTIRDQILDTVDQGRQLWTEGYRVKHGTVRDRKSVV